MTAAPTSGRKIARLSKGNADSAMKSLSNAGAVKPVEIHLVSIVR
jgi:hypothetical protein